MHTQSIFSQKKEMPDGRAAHIVIPTSVYHHYEHREFGKAIRNALYIKKYEPTKEQEQNPVVFFHGGPGIVNEEQFSITQNYFTHRGHAFYIPEVEGSKMYSKGTLPVVFDPLTMNPMDLKLFELTKSGESGLNEFTKNYADDIKDVLDYVSNQHPGKKINVITHSLGGHQILRALQRFKELNDKIEAICNIAGVSNIGASRFCFTLKKAIKAKGNSELFYELFDEDNIRFFKSRANENQIGRVIDKNNNPGVNQKMNEEFSVIYGDLSHFPPILFLHAADDEISFFQNTLSLQNKIQENNSIAHGYYFTKGGHQFIKDEGSSEIRSIALEKIEDFFQQPAQELSNDLKGLSYEDVLSEFSQFVRDSETYLSNKFPAESVEENLYIGMSPEKQPATIIEKNTARAGLFVRGLGFYGSEK